MKHNYLKHMFTALLLLCATVASAHDFEVDGIYYNITDVTNKKVQVTYKGYDSYDYSDRYSGAVTIPANVTFNGITYNVIYIGREAFFGCSGLTSILLPNSVTSIGREAFYGCSGLTSIVVAKENSVYDSRNKCNAIIETATNTLVVGCKSTIIPNNVTSIGDYAFSGCKNLTSIVIPEVVTSIGTEAFYYCSKLTYITIPKGVTSIGSGVFNGCSSLTSIEIPNGVTRISSQSFCNCSSLTSVTIPNSVTFIGVSAFSGCSSLTSVTIPNSVIYIENTAFRYCRSLTSITIPNNVTSIGSGAFDGCKSLTSITSLIPADKLFGIAPIEDVDKNTCTLYVPYGAKETYASTAWWKQFVNIVELEPTEVKVTINQYGNATFCTEYALDFSEVEGLKAYAATGYNSTTQVVTLTRVQTTKEETGLFLMGEPGEYKVPVIEYSSDNTLNLLVGTLEQTTVNSTDGAMSNYKFTITEGDEAPMFYPFEDNTIFSAGKAYLQIPTAWLPATAQRSLSIRFDNGTTTDIEEIENESVCEQNVYYDLQGRKVENPTKGIYIINGKKVFIK